MSSTIKVLQVIPKLGFGGAETGCYDLAHYLAEENCKSFLITSGGELLKHVRRDKVKVIYLPVQSKNPIIIFFNFIIIFFILLIYKIDIVHARSRAPAWSCLWACFFSGKKFVTTFHGTYNFSGKLKQFYNSIMVRSKIIIAGSNFIFNHINENYQKYLNLKKQKLMVIFRGINLEYFNKKNILEKKLNDLALDWKVDRKKFIILLPGRLTRWKGQENFIEALNLLSEEYNIENFLAIILGSNQGREVYSKKLSLLVERYRLGKKITFIEHFKEMPLAYALSNLVVSSSIEPEAFGRVTVEAMSMSKVVIVNDLGASSEVLSNSDWVFSHNIVESLTQKIDIAVGLNVEKAQEIGVANRSRAISFYNIEKLIEGHLQVYKSIIKAKQV